MQSRALATNAAGDIVVGWSSTAFGTEAFIWTADGGMRAVADVLANDFNVDMTGWHLSSAQGISADGTAITGWGINPDGHAEAWVATMHSLGDCNENGIADTCDLDCGAAGGPCDVPGCGMSADCNVNGLPDDCESDVDRDGTIDDCDNCAAFFNPGQTDSDGDGIGDLCDNCPDVVNPEQFDSDADGIGDACPCPQRGDMNDDGVLDAHDIPLFVERLLGG